ncbi:MAG: alpha-xylosidase, partial [Chitinivibrionales bacterium]|nr:alpha-xylosidase [Chitinivibrionales bacterium]MBD3358229.1 alpha-xylosidase [Chitinivibrionales bacterium]
MTKRLPAHLQITTEPIADPKAVVQYGYVRVTVLTSRLFRIEYEPTGDFDDRASQTFWFRKQPVPPYTHSGNRRSFTIETEHLTLTCTNTTKPLSAETLRVVLKSTGVVWRFGREENGNLGGPCRTLDNKDGALPPGHGLMSRDGWTVIDDANAMVFNEESWLETRERNRDRIDRYFFGYGSDYQGCLRDFTRVAGSIPLIPRWALGNWWSRYWAYT